MSVANTVIESCASTNDLLRELGESGHPHGTWISARAQTGGRGRLGREWISPPGNLYLSYLARIEERSRWGWIPLVAGIAAYEAISAMRPLPSLRLKWPNDLWLGRDKLGGILCEGVTGSNGSFVAIGVGINAASAPELNDRGTACLGLDPSGLDTLRARLIAELGTWLDRLRAAPSTAWLATEYELRAYFQKGDPISWGENPARTATVVGLGESGELRVRTTEGEAHSLYAEEIRHAT